MRRAVRDEIGQRLGLLEDAAILAQREIEYKYDKMSESQKLCDAAVQNHQEKIQVVEECKLRKEEVTEECDKCEENLAVQTAKVEELVPPVKKKYEQIAEAEEKEKLGKALAKEMTETLQKANKELASLKKKLEEGVATQEEVSAAEDAKKAGAQELAAQTNASEAAKKQLKKVTTEGKKIRRDYDKQMVQLRKIEDLATASSEAKLLSEEDLRLAVQVMEAASDAIAYQNKRFAILFAQADKKYEEQRKEQCERELFGVQHAFEGFFNHQAPVQMKSGQRTDDLLISSESQLF